MSDRANRWTAPRDPEALMWPDALGRMKACRLSFGVALVDLLIGQRWEVTCLAAEVDAAGRGAWEYRILPPGGPELRFYAWTELMGAAQRRLQPAGKRFDMVGTLVEGTLDEAAREEAHRQLRRPPTEGRADAATLAWVRADHSDRVFETVVNALAAGRQPDAGWLCRIGYVMRTQYYQANGYAGTRLFAEYSPGHPLALPYAAQCLCSYLTREVGSELVEGVARRRSPIAVPLDRDVRRYLGLGNSTGLGLVLFVDKHPRLLHRWIAAREAAVAEAGEERVVADTPAVTDLLERIERSAVYRQQDATPYGGFFRSGLELAGELRAVAAELRALARGEPGAEWTLGELVGAAAEAADAGPECAEALRALMVDRRDDIVAHGLTATIDPEVLPDPPEVREPSPAMTCATLLRVLEEYFGWALRADVAHPDADYWGWYKAGLGEYPGVVPLTEPVEAYMDWAENVPNAMQELRLRLERAPAETRVATLLDEHPRLASAVARVASSAGLPYGQVRMNVRDRRHEPMRLTRFVLEAVKGFEKMEPVDAWGGRAITLQGAPLPDELASATPGAWMHPPLPVAAQEPAACA